MFPHPIFYNPTFLRIFLLTIGVVSLLAAYLLHRHRTKGEKKEETPLLLLELGKEGQSSQNQAPLASTTASNSAPVPPAAKPAFVTLQGRSYLAADLLRLVLVLFSLVVAAGFILVLLPQPAVENLAEDLQSRSGETTPEMIAFLYVGDETNNDRFQVRGVIRNISNEPIEQLDVAIRFYAHNGSVLETAIVRLDKEIIAPDEVAQFNLVYPDYKSEFAGYSVAFKLRQGPFVPYKDMRGTLTQRE